MIGKLTGTVDAIGDDELVLDVGGVGYLVTAGTRTLARLEPGTRTVLHIETYVREDIFRLYGFLADSERACPSLSADPGLTWTNWSSTAASPGAYSAIRASIASWMKHRRCDMAARGGALMTPQPTAETRDPVWSITPHPVAFRPGSIPRMRIAVLMEANIA